MRSKEEAEDYRYFPDPDLPAVTVSDALLEAARARMPELPAARWRRYMDGWGLSADDARVLTAERSLSDYFDAAVAAYGDTAAAKPVANWIQSELLRELRRDGRDPGACPIAPADLAALVRLVEQGAISGKIAKQVFVEMYRTGDPPAPIIEREGLTQISDESALEAIARSVIEANPGQVAGYRSGKTKLMGFFVGQVM
jgi:aspartyl-tRNA(Asn)/glutamyl-tRNA(Gln) amidotransferase subunit B